MLAAAVRLVLKEPDLLLTVPSAGADPHTRLRGHWFAVLLQDLYHRLVSMDHIQIQQLLMNQPVQRPQSTLGDLNHPVCQCRASELHALTLPDLLVAYQRDNVHIFLRHNASATMGGDAMNA